MEILVCLARMENLDYLDSLVRRVILDCQENLDVLEHLDRRAVLERWEFQVLWVQRAVKEMLVPQDTLVSKALMDRKEMMGPLVSLVLDYQDFQAQGVRWVSQVSQEIQEKRVKRVSWECQECPANKELKEKREIMAYQVSQVFRVRKASLDFLDPLETLVLMVAQVKVGCRDLLGFLGRRESLEWTVSLVLLERREILVYLASVTLVLLEDLEAKVTKVALAFQVPRVIQEYLVSRVTKDFLGFLGFKGSLEKSGCQAWVKSALKEREEKQDGLEKQEPRELQDQLVFQVEMGPRVIRGTKGGLVSKERRDRKVIQEAQDFLVHLVCLV